MNEEVSKTTKPKKTKTKKTKTKEKVEAPESVEVQKLQSMLISFAKRKEMLAEKKTILKEAEDILAQKEEELSKLIISMKLSSVSLPERNFTPKKKISYFYPSATKQEERKKFHSWVNEKFEKEGHAESLLSMNHATTNSIINGAVENGWLNEGEMPPGITYKKVSYKISLTKKKTKLT